MAGSSRVIYIPIFTLNVSICPHKEKKYSDNNLFNSKLNDFKKKEKHFATYGSFLKRRFCFKRKFSRCISIHF